MLAGRRADNCKASQLSSFLPKNRHLPADYKAESGEAAKFPGEAPKKIGLHLAGRQAESGEKGVFWSLAYTRARVGRISSGNSKTHAFPAAFPSTRSALLSTEQKTASAPALQGATGLYGAIRGYRGPRSLCSCAKDAVFARHPPEKWALLLRRVHCFLLDVRPTGADFSGKRRETLCVLPLSPWRSVEKCRIFYAMLQKNVLFFSFCSFGQKVPIYLGRRKKGHILSLSAWRFVERYSAAFFLARLP